MTAAADTEVVITAAEYDALHAVVDRAAALIDAELQRGLSASGHYSRSEALHGALRDLREFQP